MKTRLGVLMMLAALVSAYGVPAHAAGLTEMQIQSILALLSSFGAEQSVLTNVTGALRGQVSTSNASSSQESTPPCISHSLYEGVSDSSVGGEVSSLQKFLRGAGVYPEASVTGFFGPATKRAVARWQLQNGLITSDTPTLTGYGVVGPATRAAIAKLCGTSSNSSSSASSTVTTNDSGAKSALTAGDIQIVSPSSKTISAGTAITVTYVVGKNILSNDPVIIERAIVDANTGKIVAGYEPLVQSAGTYSFIWTPTMPGTYQGLIKIMLKAAQYPARSGVITVNGNPTGTNLADLPIPTVSVNISPPVIPTGSSTTVLWTVTNATRCVLSYGTSVEAVSPSGSKIITPKEPTTYLVWCINEPIAGAGGPSQSGNATVSLINVYQ